MPKPPLKVKIDMWFISEGKFYDQVQIAEAYSEALNVFVTEVWTAETHPIMPLCLFTEEFHKFNITRMPNR